MEEIRILVVDDEAAERITLGEVLRLEGYHVTLAASGEQALAIVRQEPMFDLAILDLRLPGMDGLQVLDGIRRISSETIVILITGYGTLETAVQALRKGAYDFLLKPSPVEEVLVAVRRALSELKAGRHRRLLISQLQNTLQALVATTDGLMGVEALSELDKEDDGTTIVGDIQIDKGKHMVTYRGQPVELTPTEFRLLECLVGRVGEVCTPQDLVRCAQGYDTDAWGARSIVRVHIRRLRRKLEPDPENPRYILNVRGVGYLFASSPEQALQTVED
jgi:DNA-binding response OmpR family regulator